jgi:hypothetical protein
VPLIRSKIANTGRIVIGPSYNVGFRISIMLLEQACWCHRQALAVTLAETVTLLVDDREININSGLEGRN